MFRDRKKLNLVIFDDFYPQPISLFRYVEFNYYLEKIKKSAVYTYGSSLHFVNEKRNLEEIILDLEKNHPKLKNKVHKFEKDQPQIKAKLAYMVFLSNAYAFLETVEKNQIPFIFTLYPGGGFAVNQKPVDDMLRKIFSSPYFRGVITTQKITSEYLIKNNFCPREKITFIYGGIHETNSYNNTELKKLHYPVDKKTFDICFVANKYMTKGKDKGYDVFISTAKILARKYKDIRFHVVGLFSRKDIDVKALGNKIKFYGLLKQDDLNKFFKGKDLILSPNIPFILGPGSFDGFPTGGCIEAGLEQVALFVTDELDLNIIFTNNKDIVIIPHDARKISKIISKYYLEPESLYKLAGMGRKAILGAYSTDYQMGLRMKIMKSLI